MGASEYKYNEYKKDELIKSYWKVCCSVSLS